MSLSTELLIQAQFLVGKEPRQPRQASLRRAVSAAYYSLFHLLVEDAVRAMFGGSEAAELRAAASRGFQHTTMKKASQGFGAGMLAEPWRSLLAAPSPELRLVAQTFVDLQQRRNQADYDVGRPVSRTEAADLVERVAAATAAWKRIRRSGSGSAAWSSECRVFLAALLLHDLVARR